MFIVPCSLLVLSILQVLQGRGGSAADNITASTPLLVNQTVLSPGQFFELGFFTPNGSENLYVGLWFKNPSPSRVIWVANREKPISTTDRSSANLGIGIDGNLKLVDGRGNTVWSTNVLAGSNQTFASISDGGNFILQDRSSNELWGSFGDPSDTFLPGMMIGVNSRTGEKRYLTSWRSENDPSPGTFVTGMTSETPTQLVTWNGTKLYWRGGQWDKSVFIGIPGMIKNYVNGFTVVQDNNQGTTYFTYQPYNGSFHPYFYVSPTGALTSVVWDEGTKMWTPEWEAPTIQCDIYGTCGPFGVCNVTKSPICGCMEGFMPSSADEWNNGNWSKGCVRQMELNCQKSANASASDKVKVDTFLRLSDAKVPDSAHFQVGIQDAGVCQDWCLSNCSCLAYSYVSSIGCMTWSGDLLDIQDFGSNYGEDLYVRVTSVGRSAEPKMLIISLTSIFAIILVGAVMLLWWKMRSKHIGIISAANNEIVSKYRFAFTARCCRAGDAGRPRKNPTLLESTDISDMQQFKPVDAAELPIFSFDSIISATNNFDITNKLGQGGFGSVYKGKLNDSREVAVKRLASNSSQGIEEFKNEVILISKLQHRNLVRLIGCCIEREEQILMYEYLPNKSLDTFLFDAERKAELSWSTRFSIIQGVARGLLYLHKDSTLRIIHRDLKVSNILLDDKMNPKISDFGLARMFEGTQDLINTRRVVGTLGYMSPEYVMGGVFSEKSDVYSFGVILLEIVSGKKNSSIYLVEDHVNLMSYAWELWAEGRGMDLVDDDIREFSVVEAMRCIQVSLLCVQDQVTDRPNMTTVVLMLSGEFELPQPERPAFAFRRIQVQSNQSSGLSTNSVASSTLVEGR